MVSVPFGILTGHRQEAWQWNLLGLDLSPAGTLDGVESATLEWSTQSTIKGGGTLNYTGSQDFAQVLVQPVYTVTSTAGSQSWPLGVFHASTPETDWSDDAPAQQVELYDRLYELNVDQVDQTYTVQAGAGIGDAIRALVPSPLAMTDPGDTLTTAMVWDIGTTKLQIVNDLLAAANYFSLWVDGYGTFHADPYVPPSARGIAWAFADDEFSIYDPAFTVSQDRFDVPNKVIEIAQSDGTTPALVSTATNTDPTSPTSYQARGNQWIVHVDQDVTAVSQAALDAIAQRQLVSLSHPSSTLTISHGHLPLLLNDAVTFRRVPAGINVTAVVQQLSVDTGGLTKTTLLEVTL